MTKRTESLQKSGGQTDSEIYFDVGYNKKGKPHDKTTNIFMPLDLFL